MAFTVTVMFKSFYYDNRPNLEIFHFVAGNRIYAYRPKLSIHVGVDLKKIMVRIFQLEAE